MQTWQSGDVTANGIRQHYTRTHGAPHTAGDRPPLVVAHGITDDGLCWTPVAEALAPAYDVVMMDARGHGLSEAPEHGYDAATQAGDLAGAISALGLRRPAVLGHSMGAAMALMLASLYPDVPRAILLEDPPPWWMGLPPGSSAEEQRAGMRAWMMSVKQKTREALISEARTASPGWSEAELGPWADSKLRFSLNILNDFHLDPTASHDWPATLRRIACPVLLITGDPALGALVTAESAAALRANVPQLRRVHIPQAGHSIHRDQFIPYMHSVRAFLHETVLDD